MTRCKIQDETDMGNVLHDFNIVDSRGRLIGARIYYLEIEMVEVNSEETFFAYNIEPGYYFTVIMQATRNGSDFGATQKRHWFKSEIQRDAAVRDYLENAKIRAQKKSA